MRNLKNMHTWSHLDDIQRCGWVGMCWPFVVWDDGKGQGEQGQNSKMFTEANWEPRQWYIHAKWKNKKNKEKQNKKQNQKIPLTQGLHLVYRIIFCFFWCFCFYFNSFLFLHILYLFFMIVWICGHMILRELLFSLSQAVLAQPRKRTPWSPVLKKKSCFAGISLHVDLQRSTSWGNHYFITKNSCFGLGIIDHFSSAWQIPLPT